MKGIFRLSWKVLPLVAAVLIAPLQSQASSIRPVDLRCEYLTNPLGIDVARPRLSWVLESAGPAGRGLKQSAYRVLAASSKEILRAGTGNLWDSGKVTSDQSTQVVYGGKLLGSGRRAFWKLFAAFFLISIAIGGGSTSLPLILTDRGVPAQQASFVMTVVGLAMMFGRLSFGVLLDRIFAPHLTALVFLAPTVAFSVLLLPNTTSINAMIAAGFLGFGLGAEVDALAYIASRSFGLRHFGRILGFLMVAFTLGLAFGPILFGKIYDQFQTYQLALWIAAGISAVSSGLIMTLRRTDLPFTSERAATHVSDANAA